MRKYSYRFVSAFLAVAMFTAPMAARAQSAPAAPPPAAAVQQPNGEYTAPLQQQTQPSYVPQSVAMSGPPIINDPNENVPVPAGYHPETRVRKGLIIGGAITFGALYLISLLVAAAGSDIADSTGGKNGVASLYIPVFGPFVQMTQKGSSSGNVVLAIDGIGQAAGAAMLIGGIVAPKTVLVRNDLGFIQVTPMRMGKDGAGFGLTGTF